jgi:hypothetical protein
MQTLKFAAYWDNDDTGTESNKETNVAYYYVSKFSHW